MYIFKAAVIGAGAMGAEIAQVISYSGLPVLLKDVDQAMLDKGMERIRKIYQARVDKGKLSPSDMDSKLSLITPTLDYSEFSDVDIAIEAVPEKMGVKRAVLNELAAALPPSQASPDAGHPLPHRRDLPPTGQKGQSPDAPAARHFQK